MIGLDKIKEASTGEAEHAANIAPDLRDEWGRCDCDRCIADRFMLAMAAPALTAEIDRLQKYESGDLIPGKVVTDNLSAAGRWLEEERAACEQLARAWGSDHVAKAIRMRAVTAPKPGAADEPTSTSVKVGDEFRIMFDGYAPVRAVTEIREHGANPGNKPEAFLDGHGWVPLTMLANRSRYIRVEATA